jgi:hypothetical protein
MKILDLARPSWGAMAVAALAGTAVGFAVGFVVGRDPAAARRAAGRATQWAATGVEQATLWAAQLREHLGDLWAEARDASLGAVDAADFERQAAASAASTRSGKVSPRVSPGGVAKAASKRSRKPTAASRPNAKPRKTARAAAKSQVRGESGAVGSSGRVAAGQVEAARSI